MNNQQYWKFVEIYLHSHKYYNQIKDPDIVGELASELMLADHTFNGKGTLNGYRHQRLHWKTQKLFKKFRQLKESTAIPPNVSYVPKTSELKEELVLFLSKINPIHAECIKRFYLDRDTLKNIAEDMSIPMSTIYKYIQQGLESLRKIYVQANPI